MVKQTAYSIEPTYNIKYTIYSIQHTAYSIHHTVYSIQRTAYTVYSIQHTTCNIQPTTFEWYANSVRVIRVWILLLRDSYVLQIRSFRSEDHPYRYKKTYEKVHNISPLHRCFRCDALLECARPSGFRIANWDPPGRALSKRGGLTAYESKGPEGREWLKVTAGRSGVLLREPPSLRAPFFRSSANPPLKPMVF